MCEKPGVIGLPAAGHIAFAFLSRKWGRTLLLRMPMGRLRVPVGLLTMIVGGGGVLLGLVMLADFMVVSRLVMMVSRC